MSIPENEKAPPDQLTGGPVEVRVNDKRVVLTDRTPTGRQILAAAGLHPDNEYALLLWPEIGSTRELGLQEVIPLPRDGSVQDFIAVRADRITYFVLDDDRFAWAGGLNVETLRRIGRVPADRQIWLERRDEADIRLERGQSIDLDAAGVERLYTREQLWRLDVQGEPTEWDHPDILVRDALVKAGIDLTKTWTIVLKVKGKEPRPVQLSDVIDLDQPGIERLWLRPRQVDNGDGQAQTRQFSLLPKDEAFLAAMNYRWETVIDGGRRWLIIHGYALPTGYSVGNCRLALEIPRAYPAAQIDMFYCHPTLFLKNGGIAPATDAQQTIAGATFQRWSRHRNAHNQWCPQKDNVSTHLGLVDEALGREVGG